MKILLRILLYCFSALIILCAMLVFFGVGDKPELAVGWSPTRDDLVRAKKILHEGSKTKPDEIGIIELTEADLNLAGNYLLNRYRKSAADLDFKNDELRFKVTMALPENSLGKYLNISFRLGNVTGNDLPVITKFKAGKLLLPAKLAAFVIDAIIQHSSLNEYFILATRPLKAVKIDAEKLTITYYPNKDTLIQARNFLTHTGDNSTLNIYQQKLADIVAKHDPEWRLSLADLLRPLFELAYQRSTLETAIDENRVVISAINDYVNKQETKKLLSTPESTPVTGQQYAAFLYKRIDLAQHFIGSAALTASVNKQAAQIAGEEKELSDAHGGSGFSFIDLAADKAGTRFGEMATSSPENARKMQKAMSGIKDYSDFMPDPRDLPEHMNEVDFKQRFESVNSPVYQEISKQIDARISATPIYNAE
ncbi:MULTISPECIES: hypothetical protein [Methylobacter]|uniref:Uncharacterized protein n=2 Tax=Methylobacter TaxID=429 RepID=A0A2S6HGS3_9GAMM|nr:MULTISPECIES: hypothetical protein [Methylobacter]MDI1359692.1 hypothetical protein [Methylobacter sp.]PPK76593.1 hypothetical protein B0F87_103200 [Methylobacter tundripaludum]